MRKNNMKTKMKKLLSVTLALCVIAGMEEALIDALIAKIAA